MNAGALRKLAEQIRNEATRREEVRKEKCAQVMTAATGLDLLRRKLSGGRHGA